MGEYILQEWEKYALEDKIEALKEENEKLEAEVLAFDKELRDLRLEFERTKQRFEEAMKQ